MNMKLVKLVINNEVLEIFEPLTKNVKNVVLKYEKLINNLQHNNSIDIFSNGAYTISLERRIGTYRVWTNGSISTKYYNGIIGNDFKITNKKVKKELYRLFSELEYLGLK